MYGTRPYTIWRSMKKRCDNPKDKFYHRYGGRGIKYHPSWAQASNFLQWALTNGYAADKELDRIDNDGDYTPDNCRFVIHQVNAQNRIDTFFIEMDGVFASISDHAKRRGIARTTVYSRIKKALHQQTPCTLQKKGHSVRKIMMLAATLSLTACGNPNPIVSTPPASCAKLIPADWPNGVEAAPIPSNEPRISEWIGKPLTDAMVAAIVAPWAVGYVAMNGQLTKANGRTGDTVSILANCEAMVNAARP